MNAKISDILKVCFLIIGAIFYAWMTNPDNIEKLLPFAQPVFSSEHHFARERHGTWFLSADNVDLYVAYTLTKKFKASDIDSFEHVVERYGRNTSFYEISTYPNHYISVLDSVVPEGILVLSISKY